MRILISIGTALGLGAGLVCTGLFAWWLSYPVRFSVGYVGEPFGAGRMESVNPIPFLAAGLILSAVLGAASGFVVARRGWRLAVGTAQRLIPSRPRRFDAHGDGDFGGRRAQVIGTVHSRRFLLPGQ